MTMRLCLTFLALTFATAASAQVAGAPSAGDTVSGTVVDAPDAHPLSHATVRLLSIDASRARTERITPVITGFDGRYSFADVPAGKYQLTAIAPGYFSSAYLAHGNYSTAIVTGAGLDTTALQLSLTHLASISGTVLDDAGDPGQNTQVALYRVDPAGDTLPYLRAGNTNTDSEGRYSFKRLIPGRYFIAVNSTPWYAVHPRKDQPNEYLPYRTAVDPAVDVVYPTLYYPRTTRSEEAQPIDLEGGDEFTANLTLTPAPALTLTVQLPPAQSTLPMQIPQVQLLRRVFGHDEYVQINQINFDKGTEILTGVPPGVYKVMQNTGGNTLPFNAGTADLSAGSASISAAAPPPLATVTLQLHMAGDAPLPPSVQINLRDTTDRNTFANFDAKGAATVSGVPPGDYTLNVFANGPGMRVRSLILDAKTVRGNVLHITTTAPIRADITVSPRNGAADNDSETGGVTVDGIAHRDGKPAAATFVLLIPALAHYDNEDVRRDQTNLDGSYIFSNVAPGNYILIAVDEGWKLHWQDPQTLLKYLVHGIPVTIPESSGKSTYRVPDAVLTQPLEQFRAGVSLPLLLGRSGLQPRHDMTLNQSR